MKRDISIQLIRIIAMLMIFVDHLFNYISFPFQPVIVQIANSGVFIFLFISAYLYGNREIKDWKQWFKKRIIRICIPMWIFMIAVFLFFAIKWNYFDIKMIFTYLFNLQGIIGTIPCTTNLWFLTLLMICYMITPLLQWIKKKKISKSLIAAIVGCFVILQVILAYTTDIGMVIGHTLSWCMIAVGIYILGYFCGNCICNSKINLRQILILVFVMVISAAIVVLCRKNFDGTIIYDCIVVVYGLSIIGLWIAAVVYKIGTFIHGDVFVKIINHMDNISYEFYIVHGTVITIITLPRIYYSRGMVLYIVSTILLSYFAGLILHSICSVVYKLLDKTKKKQEESSNG